MKLKTITVRKSYTNRDTIKGKTGSYRSVENQAEVILTFDTEEIEDEGVALKSANDKVRAQAKDLLNDDPDWIKEESSGESKQ